MNETQPKNRRFGYARVITYGQTLAAQLGQLKEAGCSQVYRATASGVGADRRQLSLILNALDVDGPARRPAELNR